MPTLDRGWQEDPANAAALACLSDGGDKTSSRPRFLRRFLRRRRCPEIVMIKRDELKAVFGDVCCFYFLSCGCGLSFSYFLFSFPRLSSLFIYFVAFRRCCGVLRHIPRRHFLVTALRGVPLLPVGCQSRHSSST